MNMKSKVIINDYRHIPGGQCLSVILRGVFEREYIRLSNDMIMGLSSQLYFGYGCDTKTKMYEISTFSPVNFNHLMANTGVRLKILQSENKKKAFDRMISLLNNNKPVPIIVHPFCCPSLRQSMPDEFIRYVPYHWILVFGYDNERQEIHYHDPMKFKSFTMPFKDLEIARALKTEDELYDPDNRWMEYDFPEQMIPLPTAIQLAIKHVAYYYNHVHTHFPRLYVGLKGLSIFIRQIKSWRNVLNDAELINNAVRMFISINLANSVKGGFRYQYARFLEESAEITKNDELKNISRYFVEAGRMWLELCGAFQYIAKNPHDMKVWETNSSFFQVLDGVYAREAAAIAKIVALEFPCMCVCKPDE